MLLHSRDRNTLLERLKIHFFLASQYKGAHNFHVLLKYGIYEVDAIERVHVTQMIDHANEALNSVVRATAENVGMTFYFYTIVTIWL